MKAVNSTHWFCDKARRKVAGVCAGLAACYQQPRWLIRVLALLLLLVFPLATLLAYLVAALILPNR